ncbi:MAG: hypothetical protein HOH33_03345 [Verrucomicrobia bacterium]|jgi:hypothetical protein|nr:hypothetical protein [Verrucomicrobiota bacterium]
MRLILHLLLIGFAALMILNIKADSHKILVRHTEASPGKLSMIAVRTSDETHFLYDPNELAIRGTWQGEFGTE